MEGLDILERRIVGRVEPRIYAFETKTVPAYLKVGDTYRPVHVRLKEWEEHYRAIDQKYEHLAKVSDDTYFRDHAVHKYLLEHGFYRAEKSDLGEGVYYSNEFFKEVIDKDLDEAINDIQRSFDNRKNDYTFYNVEDRLPVAEYEYERNAPWKPRENQEKVIKKFLEARENGRTNLLMYAVMRFGKTFTSLCCAQRMGAKLVVVVSGKTAVREEWKENVERPVLFEGYKFLSADSLDRNPNAISDLLKEKKNVVLFLTLQDLLGDNIKERHKALFDHNEKGDIDLLIIDESHFAARSEETGRVLMNFKTQDTDRELKGYDESLDDLKEPVKMFNPKIKLHLSGTPYRILLDGEFKEEDIIAMVQYVDIVEEQRNWYKKHLTEDEWKNPYYGFPEMVRFAFNLNQSSSDRLEELRDEGIDYRLNALLRPLSLCKDSDGNYKKFKYEKEVLDLLLAIDGKKKDTNIFSFLDYPQIQKGQMCRHIVMVLPFRASCDAMEELIKSHKFNHLGEYEIINISSVNLSHRYDSSNPQYVSNIKADIERCEAEGKKTITMTVGKMLTGSTVKQWDTMIFLKGASSPQEYDQAIYRLQSQYTKTIATDEEGVDEEEKTVVYNMKPQTLLVDFDPTRMFVMQNRKSLIANVNSSLRGNEELEQRLNRELEFSPIIWLNHDKLQEVKANDIIDAVREYSRNKSIMDETFEIPVDDGVFSDNALRKFIELQPEMSHSGNVFKMDPHKGEDEGDDVDTGETTGTEGAEGGDCDNTKDVKKPPVEQKSLRKRLQTYYFKILLFAYLSDLEETCLTDVINNIENDADGARIARHLQLDAEGVRLIRATLNPVSLSNLENKINNIDTLSGDKEADCKTALRRFSRLSTSEVTTPEDIVTRILDALPEDINDNSKFLNIAGKTGEFEYAIFEKYRGAVAKNIYSLPTSGIAYECTRKIYQMLGMPVENVIEGFTTYDLVDNNKKDDIMQLLTNMKFDAVVGNPPYHEQTVGTSDKPIYHLILDRAFEISDKVTMITPARFLFNAGKTPKAWNKKVLNDEHLKVVYYSENSEKVFPVAELKGGVAITYRDAKQKFTAIKLFTAYPQLNKIFQQVNRKGEFVGLDTIVYTQNKFNLAALYKDYPQYRAIVGSDGREKRLTTSIFTQLDILQEEKKNKSDIRILGLVDNRRFYRYIPKKYLDEHKNTNLYKVVLPKTNGTGKLGETLSSPHIVSPGNGFTQSFISMGAFNTKKEAEALLKYIKTKFARCMLGILKATQDNNRAVWHYVPIQDFTSNSDIDWTKSVADIDYQLFAKYELSHDEIKFIKENIKPME